MSRFEIYCGFTFLVKKFGCCFSANKIIPTELQKQALDLQEKLEFDDRGGEGVTNHIDDEYKWLGVEDPKIVVTTSRDPSAKLKEFAKVSPFCHCIRFGYNECLPMVVVEEDTALVASC